MALFVNPFARALDASGNPLPGATLTFSQSGGATPAAVYTTAARTTAHSNPVVADAGGLVPPIYLDPLLTYRAVLRNSGGTLIQQIDPYDTPPAATVNVKDFGAKGDGIANDTSAFQAAAQAIVNADGGVLIIPPGTYMVGRQTFAGATGKGYAYQGEVIIGISDCTLPVEIRGQGARIKTVSGLKYGSFDPVTGAVYNPPSLPFNNLDYVATGVPAMISLYRNASVTISGLELDGNVDGHIIGGYYSDTGRQIPGSGIQAYNNAQLSIRDCHSHHQPLDGIMIGYTGMTVTTLKRPHALQNVRCEYNGRQGLSWVGGNSLICAGCTFSYTGRNSVGVASAPGAGVDMEAEDSICRNGVFIDCEMVDNAGIGFVADSGDSADATLIRCKFIGTTSGSVWPRKPGIRFHDCTILGQALNPYSSADPGEATHFYGCRFSGDTTKSPTGTLFNSAAPIIDFGGGDANVLMENCRFDTDGNTAQTLPWTVNAVYRDCSFVQDGTGHAYLRGKFEGQTTITTAGSNDFYNSSVRGPTFFNGNEMAMDSPLMSAAARILGNNGSYFQPNRIAYHYDHSAWANNYGQSETGDVVMPTLSAGKVLLHRCTASGTPGTWERIVAVKEQPAIGNASGGSTVDNEARTQLNALLGALRTAGVIAP